MHNFVLKALILLLMVINPLDAQKQQHSFQYELGLEFASVREDLLIPLAFNGPGAVLGLGYQKISGNWELNLDSRVKLDFMFNRFDHPAAMTSVDITPAIKRNIYQPSSSLDLQLGISTPLELNNLFLFSWDDAHLYWFTIRGLNLEMSLNKELSKDRAIRLGLSIPIVSQIARPKQQRLEKQDPSLNWLGFYSPDGPRDFQSGSYSSYQAIELSLELDQYQGRSGWELNFDYDHYSEPKDVWVLSTSLSYKHRFGKRGDRS